MHSSFAEEWAKVTDKDYCLKYEHPQSLQIRPGLEMAGSKRLLFGEVGSLDLYKTYNVTWDSFLYLLRNMGSSNFVFFKPDAKKIINEYKDIDSPLFKKTKEDSLNIEYVGGNSKFLYVLKFSKLRMKDPGNVKKIEMLLNNLSKFEPLDLDSCKYVSSYSLKPSLFLKEEIKWEKFPFSILAPANWKVREGPKVGGVFSLILKGQLPSGELIKINVTYDKFGNHQKDELKEALKKKYHNRAKDFKRADREISFKLAGKPALRYLWQGYKVYFVATYINTVKQSIYIDVNGSIVTLEFALPKEFSPYILDQMFNTIRFGK